MVELLAVEDAQVAFSTKLLMIMRIAFSGSVQMQAYVIEKRVFCNCYEGIFWKLM